MIVARTHVRRNAISVLDPDEATGAKPERDGANDVEASRESKSKVACVPRGITDIDLRPKRIHRR